MSKMSIYTNKAIDNMALFAYENRKIAKYILILRFS